MLICNHKLNIKSKSADCILLAPHSNYNLFISACAKRVWSRLEFKPNGNQSLIDAINTNPAAESLMMVNLLFHDLCTSVIIESCITEYSSILHTGHRR